MRAVVMAGGEGTRLRPLTSNQPKPMVPILNRPVMDYILDLLREHGSTDVVATLQFLPQLIKNYFGKGADHSINLNYSIEDFPLGTAGSVKEAENFLDETFLVISGDALTDFDLTSLMDFHKRKGAMVTIALKRVENPLEFGVVITEESGQIERFLEKPTWGQVFSDTVNTGIYVLETEIFKYVPKGEPFDFSKDLFPMLLEKGAPLYGCIMDGYWCDIGNFEQYMQAHRDILDLKSKIHPPGIRMRDNVWIGDGADVDLSVDISGPVVIGQNAKIEAGAELDEYSIIGNNVVMMSKAHTHRSIVWDNSYLGPHSHIHGAVVGKNCDIKTGVRIEQGVVVGDDSVMGENAVINHDVKIYPFKRVDEGAVINSNLIWESRGMRSLFGAKGISGLINIDITVDLAMKLAMAYGTTLKKDSSIVVSQDASRASRMIKRAMIAGLNSTGINTSDLRITSASINRFLIQTGQEVGGIHIRTSPFDQQSMEIHFFDSNGLDIKEGLQRDIEKYYYRQDYRRVFYNQIGETKFPQRSIEAYRSAILKAIDIEKIQQRRFKVIVDYAFGSTALTMPHLLEKLNCDVVGLNAYTSESRTTISPEQLGAAIQQLSRIVDTFKADFGIMIDSGGEKVTIVDDRGRDVSFNDALHLLIYLTCQFERGMGKIAVPLTASSIVDEIAGSFGRDVIRTKVSTRAMMEAALDSSVMFIGAQAGGYIFPRFLPAYDGIITFFKLMEYLAAAGRPLSELVASMPSYYLAHKNTFCPWDKKGLVMRKLLEIAKDQEVEMIDGIRICNKSGWALVLPDPGEPLVRVYAEGSSQRNADYEVDRFVSTVNEIIESGE
ncbi:MAG: mannose-1-phosphate guanyltransferase [Actinobacteria bacterium]|nr:mannose-1-phosphate guanyltransferase [Actinomycetota bacterium]